MNGLELLKWLLEIPVDKLAVPVRLEGNDGIIVPLVTAKLYPDDESGQTHSIFLIYK